MFIHGIPNLGRRQTREGMRSRTPPLCSSPREGRWCGGGAARLGGEGGASAAGSLAPALAGARLPAPGRGQKVVVFGRVEVAPPRAPSRRLPPPLARPRRRGRRLVGLAENRGENRGPQHLNL